MTDSIKNIRVHLGDIPDFFSPQLKDFIVKQPDFNDELQESITSLKKNLSLIQQAALQPQGNQTQQILVALSNISQRLTALEMRGKS